MQAQLAGSLEPEPEPEADLKQELHDLARLFTALRQGAQPALRREVLLDADELEGHCSYIPRPWMLSPSGDAAATAWSRILSSSDEDSSSDNADAMDGDNEVQGLQMAVAGTSGAWETATSAGGPGRLRSWSTEYGKGWLPSGRYFVTVHVSDRYDPQTGARVQGFDTAEGWLPEYFLGDANVPHPSQACFSDDESLAAAVVMDLGRGCCTQVIILGICLRFLQIVHLDTRGVVEVAWLPGTTKLVITQRRQLACVSVYPRQCSRRFRACMVCPCCCPIA